MSIIRGYVIRLVCFINKSPSLGTLLFMRLKIQPRLLFITLTALCLSFNSPTSMAFIAEQDTQSATEASKISKTKENTDTPAPTKPAEDTHQHKVIINAPIDAFEQQQQDIEHYLTEESITPILVGSEKYLIATNRHTTAVNKGVMVLIPDWQQSIATPNALNQLRQNMPEHGWTTITLHPPHKPKNYPSQALLAEERDTENAENLTSYRKVLADIMLAVIEKAKSYPGGIIVIAEGSHAAFILDIYQQKLVNDPSAFVMLSAYMPTPTASNQIAQQLAMTDYPVLDLYLKRDNRLVLANAKLRKDFAKREMKVYYRQKQLNNRATGYYPKNTLAREIISWLRSIGW